MTQAIADQLLTSGDAARVAGVSVDSIRNWADNGRLPSIRTAGGVRLFTRQDLERVVQERNTPGEAA